MLFFSDVLGAEVQNQADVTVGKLIDIVVKVEEARDYPPIAGIVLRTKNKQQKFIDSSHIESFGKGYVTLSNGLREGDNPLPSDKNLIFLHQTVLDKQIVDMAGIRVVRVNDLQFGMVQYAMSLIAIDIGKLGLLRRLGLAHLNLASYLKPELVEWKNVRPLGDRLQLSTSAQELVKLHPADVANIIEKLNLNQGSQLLQAMDQKTAARVLEELEPNLQRILVENLGPERAVAVMQKMSVDELVDLIQLLPGRKSKEIISQLPIDSKTQKVKKILEYDEDTAGGLMTTEYITATPNLKAFEMVEEIRRASPHHHSIHFIYVVDESGRLLGVVSLRRLLIADKGQTMGELAKNAKRLPTAKEDYNILKIASIMTKYNLFSIAVLDKEKQLLGVVTVDDIMRHFVPHA